MQGSVFIWRTSRTHAPRTHCFPARCARLFRNSLTLAPIPLLSFLFFIPPARTHLLNRNPPAPPSDGRAHRNQSLIIAVVTRPADQRALPHRQWEHLAKILARDEQTPSTSDHPLLSSRGTELPCVFHSRQLCKYSHTLPSTETFISSVARLVRRYSTYVC